MALSIGEAQAVNELLDYCNPDMRDRLTGPVTRERAADAARVLARKAPGQTAGWVFGEDPAWLSQ